MSRSTAAATPDERPDAGMRRHAAAAVRGLRHRGTYVGAVRELALAAFHLVAYPAGVLPRTRRSAELYTLAQVRGLAARSLLATDPESAYTPVVLVHGYVHNRSAFLVMSRALKRAGFQHVYGFNYNPLLRDIPQLSGRLAEEVDRILGETGAPRCMIVGHSMGGMVARHYVQERGGEERVDTVITIGSPHRGTLTAYLGVGPAAVQLKPGSPLLRGLEESARPSRVRWIAYWSDLDAMVVPAVNGKLVHPALRATNIRVRNTGHLSLLLSADVIAGVIGDLINRHEDRPEEQRPVVALPSPTTRRRRAQVTGRRPAPPA